MAVTQISIAEAAGVTEVTVRNRFKDLKSKLQLN
jgi:transcription initiation factor TFIIIB Brf1 subunit/transcription initiation factor TFIIB